MLLRGSQSLGLLLVLHLFIFLFFASLLSFLPLFLVNFLSKNGLDDLDYPHKVLNTWLIFGLLHHSVNYLISLALGSFSLFLLGIDLLLFLHGGVL